MKFAAAMSGAVEAGSWPFAKRWRNGRIVVRKSESDAVEFESDDRKAARSTAENNPSGPAPDQGLNFEMASRTSVFQYCRAFREQGGSAEDVSGASPRERTDLQYSPTACFPESEESGKGPRYCTVMQQQSHTQTNTSTSTRRCVHWTVKFMYSIIRAFPRPRVTIKQATQPSVRKNMLLPLPGATPR